jgi:hypothetical protein
MHLAFLSLFLGLISGNQSVSLGVSDDVVAVDLLLDGATVAHLDAAPWMAKVDFGKDLLPHHLVARAVDAKGTSLAQIEQWINLPRPSSEIELLINRVNPHSVGVHLNWQSLTSERPDRLELAFDGRTTVLGKDRNAALKLEQSDPRTHLLAATVYFPSGDAARRHVALSGSFAGGSAAELTAIPVRVAGGELPPPEQLSGWFTAAGQPLSSTAVERGDARLLVVRDSTVPEAFRHLLWFQRSSSGFRTALSSATQIRFIWPSAQAYGGSGIPSEIFPQSQDFGALDGGLPVLLARLQHGGDGDQGNRLADAVAVAGLGANAGQTPRAVLLVLTPDSKDVSRYAAPAVRHYLEALGVPFFVWSIGAPSPGETEKWGHIEDISQPSTLQQALRQLDDRLRAERIVWVEGRYLPQTIALGAPAVARHVELAAAP